MALNNPDDLQTLVDLPTEAVTLGEHEVLVRGLSAKERVDLDRSDDPDAAESLEFIIDVIMAATVADDGSKLFTDDKWRDWLRARSEKTLMSLFNPIMRMSGLDQKKD